MEYIFLASLVKLDVDIRKSKNRFVLNIMLTHGADVEKVPPFPVTALYHPNHGRCFFPVRFVEFHVTSSVTDPLPPAHCSFKPITSSAHPTLLWPLIRKYLSNHLQRRYQHDNPNQSKETQMLAQAKLRPNRAITCIIWNCNVHSQWLLPRQQRKYEKNVFAGFVSENTILVRTRSL